MIPQRRRLMDEYFKRMAPKDKVKQQKDNYMPSTVFTEPSTELPKRSKSLRGLLRQQYENRPRDYIYSSRKVFSQQKDSSRIKNALSYSYGNDNDNESLYGSNRSSRRNTGYPYHHRNTFNRIVKGDNESDINFRVKYLYNPEQVPTSRRDNVNELFKLQERYNEDEDEKLPTSPNQLCFSQMCTITHDTLKEHRNNPLFTIN